MQFLSLCLPKNTIIPEKKIQKNQIIQRFLKNRFPQLREFIQKREF